MYRGFKLSLSEGTIPDNFGTGEKIYSNSKKEVRKSLDEFLTPNKKISATKMMENWFPQIKANVFISHSHKDEDLAISFAGWLKDTFKLDSFIDSTVWGYAPSLLQDLDDKYCYKDDTENYSYQKRNRTTSHVYTMLGNALARMIDNTEIVVFLNTPNSMYIENVISKTESPWLFQELSLTQFIRKKTPKANRKPIKKSFRGLYEAEAFSIEYDLTTTHLTDLDFSALEKWEVEYASKMNRHPLDILYKLYK